jgi:hypothetical protein
MAGPVTVAAGGGPAHPPAVVVAEDSLVVRAVLVEQLLSRGYPVIQADPRLADIPVVFVTSRRSSWSCCRAPAAPRRPPSASGPGWRWRPRPGHGRPGGRVETPHTVLAGNRRAADLRS